MTSIRELASGGTDGNTSADEAVENPAALTPSRVYSSVKATLDVNDHHPVLHHLNACLLEQSARKSGIFLAAGLSMCAASSLQGGTRYPVAPKTATGSDACLGRISADS